MKKFLKKSLVLFIVVISLFCTACSVSFDSKEKDIVNKIQENNTTAKLYLKCKNEDNCTYDTDIVNFAFEREQ